MLVQSLPDLDVISMYHLMTLPVTYVKAVLYYLEGDKYLGDLHAADYDYKFGIVGRHFPGMFEESYFYTAVDGILFMMDRG